MRASSTAWSLFRKQVEKTHKAHNLHSFLWKCTKLQLEASTKHPHHCMAERRLLVSCSHLVQPEHPSSFSTLPSPAFIPPSQPRFSLSSLFSCSSLSQIPFLTRWHPEQEQSSGNRCQWPAHLSACQPWVRCGVLALSLPALPELWGA